MEKRLKELNVAIAKQIRQFLEKNEMSQAEFAKQLGADRSFVTRLLAGEYNPTLKTLTELEAVLGKKILKIEP